MYHFKANLQLIGINPFVFVPEEILHLIFARAEKNKGPIPVIGTINGNVYIQTLLRYQGHWRLYINTQMLKNSPKRIGEEIEVSIDFDLRERNLTPHPQLLEALENNPKAKAVFESLAPSLQKEIVRNIANLKTPQSVTSNIQKAVGFLLGKNRFIGRDHH